MPERLGEFLVKAGRINERQLSQVLERQVTMGGRLGTNLVELGYLSESELTRFLSRKLNIPSLNTEELEAVDPNLFQLVPRDVAQKYQVIPIKRERNVLSVALLDPTDLELLDELRFITGCVIKPYIASEARIQFALERYYHIHRQLRYVSLLGGERALPSEEGGSPGGSARKEPSPEDWAAAGALANEEWISARDRDEVITTLLRAMSIGLDRGILFLIKAGKAAGWRAFPVHREPEIAGTEFDLKDSSLFMEVVEARTFFLGSVSPGANGPSNEGLFRTLGGSPPSEILLIPVMIGDQVVAVFYGDNGPSKRPIQSVEILRKLTRKAAMALEILILKKKILEL